MSPLSLPVLLATFGLLAGCAAPGGEAPSPNFGRAAASLQSQWTPAAADAPEDTPADSSAARGVAAIRRYEKGEPKPLEAAATSAQSGSSATRPETQR